MDGEIIAPVVLVDPPTGSAVSFDGQKESTYDSIDYKDAKKVIKFCCDRNKFCIELTRTETKKEFLTRFSELLAEIEDKDCAFELSVIFETMKKLPTLLFN